MMMQSLSKYCWYSDDYGILYLIMILFIVKCNPTVTHLQYSSDAFIHLCCEDCLLSDVILFC